MKALKIVGIAVGGLLVLLLVAVAVLSLPAVQRALVVQIASGDGRQLELDYFHAGPRQVEIRGLDFSGGDGAVYRASEVTAEMALADLVFGRRLELGHVVANDLVIDLSAPEPADGEEPFNGVLEQLELPMPFSLDSIRANGQLLLPGETEPEPLLTEFQIRGGGFAPGERGELQWVGELTHAGRLAPLPPLVIEGDLALFQTVDGAIDEARVLALISVSGNADRPRETLSADVMLLATGDGEEYQARISRVQANQADAGNLSTLIVLDAVYQREDGVIAGRWELQVDEQQLAAFVGETELPPFAANGRGEFTYGMEGDVAAAGELRLEMENLGPLLPQLRELGAIALDTDFDLVIGETAVRLSETNLRLRQEERTVLEVRNFQPIVYDLEAGELRGAEGRIDLAEVTVRALPVEWANLFLPAEEGETETTVEGGAFTGQLLVSSDGGAVLFDFVEPLRADGIAVFAGEERLLSGVALLVDGSGRFLDGEFQANVDPLELASQGEVFLSGFANIDSAGPAEARFDASLPFLLNLPLLQDYNNLSSGNARISLALSAEEPRELRATVAANSLVTADEQQPLPDLDAEAVLRRIAENAWSIEAPIRLEGAQPSDLTLQGEIATGETVRFDLALTGEQFFADQALALAGGFSAPETGQTGEPSPRPDPPPTTPAGRDQEPFWSGAEGIVTLDVARVHFEDDYVFDEITGELSLSPEAASSSLQGEFLGEPMTVRATVQFLSAEEEPYVMEGMVEAPNLPVGALFRQFQPNRPPTLEGLFAASVEIVGSGRNLEDLVDGTRGRIHMRSGGGVIRLLHSENPLAGLGFAASAILSRFGGEVGAISSVASQLGNMSYNEINLEAQRDEQLNLVVENFAVVAPELHLRGVGIVRHREDVPVLDQPMELRFQMGVSGALEETLDSLRVLEAPSADGGYVPLRDDFVITGTPANPNSLAFYRLLANTVMRFVDPGSEEEREERPRIPQLPDILDIFGGGRDRG